MDHDQNAGDGKNVVRQEFARRLREKRVPRGFRTARSLARALSIDENRYTRYERAEVEPDLELLMRICDALDVTPNDLLGVEPAALRSRETIPDPAAHPPSGAAGLAEPAAGSAAADAESASTFAVQSIGWMLCRRIAQLRRARDLAAITPGCRDTAAPLADLQMVSDLQHVLVQQPFDFIRETVRDPAVLAAPDAVAREVRDLILRLTEALARMAEAPPRG